MKAQQEERLTPKQNTLEKTYRVTGVSERLSVSKSTVWLYVRQGKLAKPRKLSPRVSVWMESDIQAFLEKASA